MIQSWSRGVADDNMGEAILVDNRPDRQLVEADLTQDLPADAPIRAPRSTAAASRSSG